jgi:predicted RNA-binding protein with PUA-like domain|tara:strand:+ start:47395 stop:47859 length:465 start_codon:yes stop_codon:yes gene_type:complete
MIRYWLLKSEPSCFSIEDLQNMPHQTSPWDGIRNYQARNFMCKEMQIGDQAFFYHSSCATPGIVGTIEIVSQAYPDDTAFDPTSDHPDPKSTPENPRWFMVDVRFKQKFSDIISLSSLKTHPELDDMRLLQKGNRLSILPVSPDEWAFISNLSI